MLNSDRIVSSTQESCFSLTMAGISGIPELELSQEVVDTKIILHVMYLREDHNLNVKIFYPFGDTEFKTLLLGFIQDHKEHI